jgi:hypothetical protein
MLKTKMLVAVVALLGIMAESHERHPWREHQEDRILRAAGFEPEEDDLWRRRSRLLFGREAALQVAFRELRERGEGEVSDET